MELPFTLDDFEPLDRPHWEALKEGRLLIQRCRRCRRTYSPAVLCSCSTEPAMEWIPSVGKGKLHAFATFHRAYAPHLNSEIPYTVCVVELDEGPLIVSRLEAEAGTPRIDDRVQVRFRDPDSGITTHYFVLEAED